HGIAAAVWIDERIESGRQLRIGLCQPLPAATGLSHATVSQGRGVELLQCLVDSWPGDPSRTRHQSHSTVAENTSLGSHPQTPLAFVQVRRNGSKPRCHRRLRLHRRTLTATSATVNVIQPTALTPPLSASRLLG